MLQSLVQYQLYQQILLCVAICHARQVIHVSCFINLEQYVSLCL